MIEQYKKQITMDNLMQARRVEFIKGLAHIMECGGEKVKPECRLDSLGHWDSMSAMQVLVLIDEVYAKEVHGRDVIACETVEQLLGLAEK